MAWDPVPADVRPRLRALRIASRRIGALRGGGLHRNRDKGAGLEFSQYRGYEPGDELRRVDWKLYARSDRFFVREAERDSPLAVWALLDASASMLQSDESRPDWRRLDAAVALAACVVEVALRQGDRAGLVVLGGSGVRCVQAAGGARQGDRIRLELHGLTAEGVFPAASSWAPLWQRIAPGDPVVVIGDFLDDGCADLAVRLAATGRDVSAIQVLTVAERDFPFDDGRRFLDPETGEALPGDARALRAGFLARFGDAQRGLRARLQAAGVRHAVHMLDEALDAPLQRLFAPRSHAGMA